MFGRGEEGPGTILLGLGAFGREGTLPAKKRKQTILL